jgi:hypothetical protein
LYNGLTPINIKAEEVVTPYNITTGSNYQKYQIDKAEKKRNWLYPVKIVNFNDKKTTARSNCGISSRMAARAKKEWDQGLLY